MAAKTTQPKLLAGGNPQVANSYLDIHEHDPINETQLAAWVLQASRLPGWGKY